MKSWVKVLAPLGRSSDTVPLNIPFKQGGALPGLVVQHGCWVVMSLYRDWQRSDAANASGTFWACFAHSLQLCCRSIRHTLDPPLCRKMLALCCGAHLCGLTPVSARWWLQGPVLPTWEDARRCLLLRWRCAGCWHHAVWCPSAPVASHMRFSNTCRDGRLRLSWAGWVAHGPHTSSAEWHK